MEDYIEDIKLSYPECSIVKDPFANRIGNIFGFDNISRFWDYGRYRLTFNYKNKPLSMPNILFSWDGEKPCQVYFDVGKSVVSTIETLSLKGYTIFISNSWWKIKNVVWQPYLTKEQNMIDLDLKYLT